MKNYLKNLFQKGNKDQGENTSNLKPNTAEVSTTADENDDDVAVGTKIKVLAALLVVGFAGYIAYWIQEPVEVRTDIFGSTMQSDSQMPADASMSQMVALDQNQTQTQQISIKNFSFNPSTLNVDKGTTIVWTNNDQVPHNVVGDNFASGTLNPGDSYSYTFDADGSFAYQCTFHPQMAGTIIVGNGAAQTQATSQEVLSGFGAGTSLGLQDQTASDQPTSDQGAIAVPVPDQNLDATVVATETSAPVTPPEQVYTSTAPAPADPLHDAALQSISGSLSNVTNLAASAQGHTPLADSQEALISAQNAAAAASATPKKLASSGPEDFVYLGMFGLTLVLNRGKLGKNKKSKNKK